MWAKLKPKLRYVPKILIGAFFCFLLFFNVQIALDDGQSSGIDLFGLKVSSFVSDVFASYTGDGYYYGGGGGGGNSTRGWQFLYVDSYKCCWYQWASGGVLIPMSRTENANVFGCVLFGADIPDKYCVPGQLPKREPAQRCARAGEFECDPWWF